MKEERRQHQNAHLSGALPSVVTQIWSQLSDGFTEVLR